MHFWCESGTAKRHFSDFVEKITCLHFSFLHKYSIMNADTLPIFDTLLWSMDIYINPDKSPAAVQARISGTPITSLRLKRGANLNFSVIIIGSKSANNLRFGIKAKGDYEGALLAYAEATTGQATDDGMKFDLSVSVVSAALNEALDVGSGYASTAASLSAVAEFAWQEDGAERISDTINTSILNDIIRLATEAPEAAAGEYPAPDLVATKAWVNNKQATASVAGFVMLGTNDKLSGKNVRPVGKNEAGGLAVDVSGLSAYEIAKSQGFVGTEAAWLASLKGERGSNGEQGMQGESGASAYDLWLEDGNSGDKTDFFADLGASALATLYESPPGTATDNANVYGFGMVMKNKGRVLALSTQCRTGGNAAPANTDILAKVWIKDSIGNKALLATSTNYQQHRVGETMRWVFDPFEVERGDMLLVTFHTSDYVDGTQYAAGHQCCFAVTSTTEPESGCIGGDGQWQYTHLIPLYTWELQVRHASDTVSHLSANEHAGLALLLANKDALLALINP